MITFDESFFLGETRDDFYIEERMKRAWAAEMEVLQVIHQICQRHSLRWFACWGTLLGAVRHKGFIPWDDDIDICMLRSDYNRFLQVARAELPENFQLSSPYTCDNWTEPFALVSNSKSYDDSPGHLSAFHGCPYMVGVDIFPLDALPVNPEEESAVFALYSSLFCACEQMDTAPAEVMEFLPTLEELCHISFDVSGNLKNQLLRATDKVSQLYDISECDCITSYPSHACAKIPFRKEWFAETVLLPFENITVPVPKEYDSVLTVLYGDYMTPVRNLQDHDYPFFKNQRKEGS